MADFAHGTEVTLQATPVDGYQLSAWEGDCEGPFQPCVVTIDADRTVQARFGAELELRLMVLGSGTGTIRTPGGELTCDADCVEQFGAGAELTLVAEAGDGSTFVGWSVEQCGTNVLAPAFSKPERAHRVGTRRSRRGARRVRRDP